MFFNDIEKELFTPLMTYISAHPGETLVLLFGNSEIGLNVLPDTFYESDNGLSENDPKFKEYFAGCFKALNDCELLSVQTGELIEISQFHFPRKISDINGNLIVGNDLFKEK